MDTFYERVEQIAAHYKMKTRELLRRCDVPYPTFRSARFRQNDPQLKTVLRILHTCPRVRMEWLVTGKGDMLLPDPNEQQQEDNEEIVHLQKQITRLKELLLEKEKWIIELEIKQSE